MSDNARGDVVAMGLDIECTRLRPEAYAQVATWLANPRVNRWLYSEWRERRVDERLIALAAKGSRNAMWLCTVDKAAYGLVAVGNIARTDRSGTLWYARNPFLPRRAGAMTAGVIAACRAAFDEVGLHSLYASVQTDNLASEALLKTVGFSFIGVRRDAFCVDRQFVDGRLFDLLPNDLSNLSSMVPGKVRDG